MFRNLMKSVVMAICLITISARAAQKPLVFLPFNSGESWYCAQGPGGGYSHGQGLEESYDWWYTSSTTTFGHAIYSPVRGKVILVKNDIQDYVDNNTKSSKNAMGAGNYVIIYDAATGKYVRMLHFKQGSITVKVNDIVNIGTYIGQIGMTGYTTGPHVHMDVKNGTSGDTIPFGYVEGLGVEGEKLTCGITPQASVLDNDSSVNIGHNFGSAFASPSTGSWFLSNWTGVGFTGDDYVHNAYVTSPGKFTWQFTVKENGYYMIKVRWKPALNRDTKAKYTAMGSVTYINQQSGGDWYAITKPYLKTGTTYTVTLEGTTKGTYIVADAIMLVKQ